MGAKMSIESIIQSMSTAEKVGQMFMLAFAGDQLDAAQILMREHFVGGAYLGDENVPTARDAVDLTNTLRGYARQTRLGIPPLLGVDQEGTWSVMTAESAMGPGNMALGASGDPQLAYDMYHMIGAELSSVGLNTLLAPAADCNSNPHNSIIGMRSFGEDPVLVAAMTAAGVRGAQDAGVAATVKHFPGHGDTTVDSHRGLPTVSRSLEDLRRIDLHPFAAGIDAGVKLVMTAHIIFSALDADNPATLSRVILGDVLRGELGFEGVIVSDSMNMASMKRNYDPAEAAIRAFNAGVDLMMLAEEHYDHDVDAYLDNQRALIGAVIDAVNDGRISGARVDDALWRILTLKQGAGFATEPLPDKPLVIGSDAHLNAEIDIAGAGVAILRDEKGQLPLDAKQPVTLINTTERKAYEVLTRTRGIGPNQATPAFDYFADSINAHCQATLIGAEDFEAGLADEPGPIVAVAENYTLPGMDFARDRQIEIIRQLHEKAGDRLVVVALSDPYQLAEYAHINCYICSFSPRRSAATAAAAVLFGYSAFSGQSPVTVPGTEIVARSIR